MRLWTDAGGRPDVKSRRRDVNRNSFSPLFRPPTRSERYEYGTGTLHRLNDTLCSWRRPAHAFVVASACVRLRRRSKNASSLCRAACSRSRYARYSEGSTVQGFIYQARSQELLDTGIGCIAYLRSVNFGFAATSAAAAVRAPPASVWCEQSRELTSCPARTYRGLLPEESFSECKLVAPRPPGSSRTKSSQSDKGGAKSVSDQDYTSVRVKKLKRGSSIEADKLLDYLVRFSPSCLPAARFRN